MRRQKLEPRPSCLEHSCSQKAQRFGRAHCSVAMRLRARVVPPRARACGAMTARGVRLCELLRHSCTPARVWVLPSARVHGAAVAWGVRFCEQEERGECMRELRVKKRSKGAQGQRHGNSAGLTQTGMAGAALGV